MTRKWVLAVVVTLIAMSSLPTALRADTITVSNVQFTAFVTSTQVTLQIQCLAASCANWFLGDVTVKGFTFTSGPTLGTAPSGYTVFNGGQNNDAVGSGGGCNGSDLGKAVCWDAPSPTLTTQLGSSPIIFTANITGGSGGLPTTTLSVMATAYNNSAGLQTNGGKVLAVSNELGPGGTIVPVPEPATMILFGSGLLSVATVVRRRLR